MIAFSLRQASSGLSQHRAKLCICTQKEIICAEREIILAPKAQISRISGMWAVKAG